MNERLRVWRLLVELLNGRDDSGLTARFERAVAVRPSRWSRLVSLANEELVTAPLWSALRRRQLEPIVPADLAAYLRDFHAFNAARNRAILAQLDELVAALNAASIEPMLLKGSAYLVAGLFPDLSDRYLADIDVLVPEGVAPRTERILAELGYRPANDLDYSRHHHLVPMIHENRPVAIELHRASVPLYAQPAIPAAELWPETVPSATGNARSRLASPTDMAMLSFIHSHIVDRNGASLAMPLRLFRDVALLQQRYGQGGIDWQKNMERAARIGAAAGLRRFLYVLRALTGLEPSRDVRAPLADGAYLLLCRAAVAWPAIAAWARRTDHLSRRATQLRHGRDALDAKEG